MAKTEQTKTEGKTKGKAKSKAEAKPVAQPLKGPAKTAANKAKRIAKAQALAAKPKEVAHGQGRAAKRETVLALRKELQQELAWQAAKQAEEKQKLHDKDLAYARKHMPKFMSVGHGQWLTREELRELCKVIHDSKTDKNLQLADWPEGIDGAFLWHETKKGAAYWDAVCQRLKAVAKSKALGEAECKAKEQAE